MNTKAVIFDFDQTIYDHSLQGYPKSCIKALKQLKEKGILIFINTARALDSYRFLELEKFVDIDGIISYNGSVVTINNKTIHYHVIDEKTVREARKFSEEHNICTLFYTKDSGYLVTKTTQLYRDYLKIFKDPKYRKREYKNEEIIGIVFFMKSDLDHLIVDLKGFKNRYSMVSLELTAKENRKDEGIKVLFDHLDLKKEEVISFGDDIQDIDMFSCCGFNVAMGNAKDEVKKASDMVTDDISKDGLYNALKKLEVI